MTSDSASLIGRGHLSPPLPKTTHLTTNNVRHLDAIRIRHTFEIWYGDAAICGMTRRRMRLRGKRRAVRSGARPRYVVLLCKNLILWLQKGRILLRSSNVFFGGFLVSGSVQLSVGYALLLWEWNCHVILFGPLLWRFVDSMVLGISGLREELD